MAKHFIAVERNGSMVFEEQDIDDYGKLIKTDDNVVLFTQKDKCDKYDYLIAVVCGAIGGLVDVFLVGSPGNSVLGGWTDKQVDNVVMQFSKMTGWHPKSGNEKMLKVLLVIWKESLKLIMTKVYLQVLVPWDLHLEIII